MCHGMVLCLDFRISVCRVAVCSLESLFVRSNRISVCRITEWSLEYLLVRSNRIIYVTIKSYPINSSSLKMLVPLRCIGRQIVSV